MSDPPGTPERMPRRKGSVAAARATPRSTDEASAAVDLLVQAELESAAAIRRLELVLRQPRRSPQRLEVAAREASAALAFLSTIAAARSQRTRRS